uniref:baseplate J/gp47 family protein n=1 Tax=Ferrovibrio terrae TaxID=2594003 RepID=UPI003137E458
MPFNRPTLQEVRDRIATSIQGDLPGLQLRYSPTGILGSALADEMHILYGWQLYLSQQYFPYTAEDAYLELHASWWGIYRTPATAAAGKLNFAAPVGTPIPAGTTLRRADGVEVATIADVITAANPQAVDVVALIDGIAGNTAATMAFSMIAPVADVQTIAIVHAAG